MVEGGSVDITKIINYYSFRHGSRLVLGSMKSYCQLETSINSITYKRHRDRAWLTS
jgi:hypothetical protein